SAEINLDEDSEAFSLRKQDQLKNRQVGNPEAQGICLTYGNMASKSDGVFGEDQHESGILHTFSYSSAEEGVRYVLYT
ncbi:hypothetical protein STEG23_016711, partial [Scotinomys teguina]